MSNSRGQGSTWDSQVVTCGHAVHDADAGQGVSHLQAVLCSTRAGWHHVLCLRPVEEGHLCEAQYLWALKQWACSWYLQWLHSVIIEKDSTSRG